MKNLITSLFTNTKRSSLLIFFLLLLANQICFSQCPSSAIYTAGTPSSSSVIGIYNPAIAYNATTNPSSTGVTLPAGSGGLSYGPNLNGGLSPTWYTTILATDIIMYWDGSAWVSTGHTIANASNNIAQGPGCMYAYNPGTGQVYRYNGTGNATLVTTLPVTGGLFDIAVDVNCNFYLMNTQDPSGGTNYQALTGYSPTGVQQSSCTLTSMPTNVGGAAFAITGNTVVVANVNGLYDGTAAAGNVTFTVANGGNQGWLNDMATCPISANGPCIIPLTLPIELIDFSAKLNAQKTVDLTWETASERNNDYFTIDKSTDGVNWTFLETIDGHGTTTIPKNYSTIDESPSLGINYYRLKQTDFDGAESDGIIKAVKLESEGSFLLSPNPGKGLVFLNGKDLSEYEIDIFNNLGENVHVKLDVVNDLQVVMNTSNLAAGVYYVSLRNSNSNQILKLIIQN